MTKGFNVKPLKRIRALRNDAWSPMTFTPIAEITTIEDNGGIIRVSVEKIEPHGHRVVNIRRWKRLPDGTLSATNKGITFSERHLSKIRKALKEANALLSE